MEIYNIINYRPHFFVLFVFLLVELAKASDSVIEVTAQHLSSTSSSSPPSLSAPSPSASPIPTYMNWSMFEERSHLRHSRKDSGDGQKKNNRQRGDRIFPINFLISPKLFDSLLQF